MESNTRKARPHTCALSCQEPLDTETTPRTEPVLELFALFLRGLETGAEPVTQVVGGFFPYTLGDSLGEWSCVLDQGRNVAARRDLPNGMRPICIAANASPRDFGSRRLREDVCRQRPSASPAAEAAKTAPTSSQGVVTIAIAPSAELTVLRTSPTALMSLAVQIASTSVSAMRAWR